VNPPVEATLGTSNPTSPMVVEKNLGKGVVTAEENQGLGAGSDTAGCSKDMEQREIESVEGGGEQ
jgi:hypothetical protein